MTRLNPAQLIDAYETQGPDVLVLIDAIDDWTPTECRAFHLTLQRRCAEPKALTPAALRLLAAYPIWLAILLPSNETDGHPEMIVPWGAGVLKGVEVPNEALLEAVHTGRRHLIAMRHPGVSQALFERLQPRVIFEQILSFIADFEANSRTFPAGSRQAALIDLEFLAAAASQHRLCPEDLSDQYCFIGADCQMMQALMAADPMLHIDTALALYDRAARTCVDYSRFRIRRASAYLQRWRLRRDRVDLDNALAQYASAASIWSDLQPGERAWRESEWAEALAEKGFADGTDAEVARALDMYAGVEAQTLAPPSRCAHLTRWADCLQRRSRPEDHTRAVQLTQEIELYWHNESSYGGGGVVTTMVEPSQKATGLEAKYIASGDLSYLSQAIAELKPHVTIAATFNTTVAIHLLSLLNIRASFLHDEADAREALQIAEALITRVDPVHADWQHMVSEVLNTWHRLVWRKQDPAGLYRQRGVDLADRALSTATDPHDIVSHTIQLGLLLEPGRHIFRQYEDQGHKTRDDENATRVIAASQRARIHADGLDLSRICWQLGRAYLARYDYRRDPGDLAHAEENARTAVEHARTVLEAAQSETTRQGRTHQLANSLDLLSGVLARDGRLREAVDAAKEVVLLFEGHLTGLPQLHGQLVNLELLNDLYRDAAMICHQLVDTTASADERRQATVDAWTMVERGRSRLTLQTLVARLDETSTIEKEDRTMTGLRKLLGDVRAMTTELNRIDTCTAQELSLATPHEVYTETLRVKREHLLAKLNQITGELEEARPSIRNYPEPQLAQVQGALRHVPDGGIVLQLIPDNGGLQAYVITPDDLRITRVPGLANFMWPVPCDTAGRLAAQQLGKHLSIVSPLIWEHLSSILEPLAGLREGDRPPHLFLVLGYQLQPWPVWALPLPNGHPLIDHFACSVLPAAGALPILLGYQEHTAKFSTYNGFAPTESDDFAAHQIIAEAKQLGGYAAVGRGASISRVLGARGIVSIATHSASSIFDSSSTHSWLVLRDRSGNLTSITAAELAIGLSPQVSPLMCLWSCQSHGTFGLDDSWMGLTGALLAAATSVVATGWPVSDLCATAVACRFWEGFIRGLTAPQALRAAVRDIRQADVPTVVNWGYESAWHLPPSLRTKYIAKWCAAVRAQGRDRPFAEFRHWAAYCAAGWPYRLVNGSA